MYKNILSSITSKLRNTSLASIAILVIILLVIRSSNSPSLTQWVDPFLGTGGHGHVYPGATVPFGMVQLSPDNGDQGWDWCSGYHYSSGTIAGFSHKHLSGTGIGDWCDISVLPLTDTEQIRQSVIKIPFSHKNESARPGYYSVQLDNKVACELTADKRSGYHRYRFPGNTGWIRFDMGFHINWDEPTAGMTHQDVDRISALIKKVAVNRTVLMVEHNLSVVSRLCDRITVLARGAVLAEGDYATVSADPRVREAYLGE